MDRLMELGKALEEKVIGWRRTIHRLAEPGGAEVQTAALVEREAERLGLPVLDGGQTSRIAVLDTGRPGKTVLLRADLDALPVPEHPENLRGPRCVCSENPGYSHACGHDAHTAMLLGAMELLTDLRGELTGRILFCFESDEENGNGWPKLLPVLQTLKIDRCFAIHVLNSLESGKISIQPGGRMSGMVAVDAAFVGRGGHGSRPDLSVNPVFAAAAALSNLAVAAANRITPGEVLTLGITAIQGGSVFNVIPDRARILGTMRYFRREIGSIALEMEKSVFDHTAAMYGCTVEYAPRNRIYLEPVVNDPDCVRMARASLPGEWLADCEPWYASETFSVCMNRWPGALAFLGVKNGELGSGAEHHNERFDVDESALWRGVVCYAGFALEALK